MTRLSQLEQQIEHYDKLIATLDETRKELVKQRDEAWDEKIDIETEQNMQSFDERHAAFKRGDMQ